MVCMSDLHRWHFKGEGVKIAIFTPHSASILNQFKNNLQNWGVFQIIEFKDDEAYKK